MVFFLYEKNRFFYFRHIIRWLNAIIFSITTTTTKKNKLCRYSSL
jgi:hypothetical protein